MSETLKSLAKKRDIKLLMTQPESSIFSQSENVTSTNKDDEMKEISLQLVMIRKKHDELKRENESKRMQLENLKKDLEKLTVVVSTGNAEDFSFTNKISKLETAIEMAKIKIDEEMINKDSYEHVLQRMKQERIALEKESNTIQHSLSSTRSILESEKQKSLKHRESKDKSKQLLKELRDSLTLEIRRKDERAHELEQQMRFRNEITEKRRERLRKQAEVAEAAANEDQFAHEVQMKEKLIINRFWYGFIQWKMEKDWQNSTEIESAFQNIRAMTGLNSIEDIVQKFASRDEDHNILIQKIAESEKNLDDLKTENENTRKQLRELLLVKGENNDRPHNSELRAIEDQIEAEDKELNNIKDQKDKAQVYYQNLLTWGGKILNKLNYKGEILRMELPEIFAKIQEQLKVIIEPMVQTKEEFMRYLDIKSKKNTQQLLKEIYTQGYKPKFVKKGKSPELENEQEKLKKAERKIARNMTFAREI
ncbi:unnamed protein product [Blepharisma stoltei]|uniref:Uncharacterized protein n=1 Tax=Blepharisma stoltei TaxID=1481888 RepID=A0AAU9JCL4_9CILI|nr:unnamed protein product [Blepharisma stoltei]